MWRSEGSSRNGEDIFQRSDCVHFFFLNWKELQLPNKLTPATESNSQKNHLLCWSTKKKKTAVNSWERNYWEHDAFTAHPKTGKAAIAFVCSWNVWFWKKTCSNFISYLTKSRRPAVWQETKKNRKGSQDDRTHKQVSTRALPSTQVIKQYRANQ